MDPLDLSVDEAWLAEWAAVGIAAAERLLASHAAFAAYLSDLESGSGNGDPNA